MKISIVIPNYNGEDLLKKNLPKVIAAAKELGRETEVVVTDDASRDNSLKFLENFSQQNKSEKITLRVVKSPFLRNSGFSANVNRGVAATLGEIIILLNTDVSPHNDFLTPLLEHFNDNSLFAVGCMDESREEGKTILRGIGLGKWHRGFLLHAAGDVKKIDTLWVSGGSGAFRKSMWDRLGGLEQLYNPFYWEDIDLSYRAQKSGFTVCFESKSRVIHEHSKGAIKSQYKPFSIQKIAYRNQFFLVWLNITDKKLLFSHFFWLPFHILSAIKSNNKAFLVGFITAVLKLPEVLHKRKQYTKNFVITDSKIINKFNI